MLEHNGSIQFGRGTFVFTPSLHIIPIRNEFRVYCCPRKDSTRAYLLTIARCKHMRMRRSEISQHLTRFPRCPIVHISSSEPYSTESRHCNGEKKHRKNSEINDHVRINISGPLKGCEFWSCIDCVGLVCASCARRGWDGKFIDAFVPRRGLLISPQLSPNVSPCPLSLT